MCVCTVPYSRILSREKTFANFAYLWRFTKVFSAKIYFQAIRYRASGCGALGYHKLDTVLVDVVHWVNYHKLDTVLVGVVHWVTTN